MTPPTNASIRQSIEKIAREELAFSKPLPDGELSEHLDSIQRLSFVVAIEDHFEIMFEPEDDERARTIQDVIQIIQQKLS